MIKSILSAFLAFPFVAAAQFSYVTDQTIPVSDLGGNALTAPWAGGLNAAQYNTLDLNHDEKDDLVLFDRTANKVITYLNQDNQYVYAKDYENFFPAGIENWILLRDFNCDGKKDLFTGDLFGIKVYTNKTEEDGTPEWEQFFFYAAPSAPKSPVILTKGFSSLINLQIQFDDLPSVEDMDGDGDLDILNVRYPGGGTIEFHKNFSKERYGTCDSLEFERVTQSWGNFSECVCGIFAFNNTPCPAGGRLKHAGGKSLLAIDFDGDSDKDLLFSESSCTRLYALENTGTAQNAVVTTSSAFPSPDIVNFDLFPAAFYEDVDFDGTKDFISTPNIYFNDFPVNTPDLQRSNWLYKNTGSDAQPNFTFIKNNFLQDQMIDIGDRSVPAFADYDADGDLDMFISQFTSPTFIASVYLYENIGTVSEPEFQFVTNDFTDLGTNNLFNVKLQWVDITGDGKTDMVFSATSFQDGVTSLYFLANKSADAFDFRFQPLENTSFILARNENVYVTDVDQDGILDILLGKSNGAVEFWKNNGPAGFNYTLQDESFLGLSISVLRQNPRCVVADLDTDGYEDLLLGDQSGSLKIISNYHEAKDATEAITDFIYNDVLKAYANQNLGGQVWPEVANIFNSTKPAIIVGNTLGGVQVLRHDEGQSLPDQPSVSIYPVPVQRQETLHIRVDRPTAMEIYSMLGQRISDPVRLAANRLYDYKVPFLSSGVYLLRFTTNNKSTVKRIVIY